MDEETRKEIDQIRKDHQDLLDLLKTIVNQEGKLTVNMSIQEMIIYIKNQAQTTVDVSTSTVLGKILFCAVSPKGFNRQPFTFTTMQNKLREFGWAVADGTLSNNLTDLTGKAWLIKEGTSFRLPTQVTFTGEGVES
jgi:hypothetical protein